MPGQPARLCILAGKVDQPQIAAPLVGIEVGLAQYVHREFSVGRYLRIADTRQLVQVGGRQCASRIRAAGVDADSQGERQRAKQP